MKKITVATIILILLILTVLIFDWGRREVKLSEMDQNISTTTYMMEQNSSSTSDMPIIVNAPTENQKVSSPIKISGKALGNWFFEATFPIQMVDPDGNIIATTVARADSDWATTSFVNFTAELDYGNASSSGPALIVLSNDNPSGNPDYSQSIFIPVILK